MAEAFVLEYSDIDPAATIGISPKNIAVALSRAINTTTARTRTAAARLMREQVNFPAQYLSGQAGQLVTGDPASPGKLESSITGRQRPTSLARFAVGGLVPGKRGVKVKVKAGGGAVRLAGAFAISLRGKSADVLTKNGFALAVRIKPGEKLRNRKVNAGTKSGLNILYGPSVDQVFRSVREDVADDALDFLEAETLRLIAFKGAF